jgi:acylphosphatase
VGFRFTCQSLAQGFAVAGYVRNLPDGDVEVLAEGEPTELDRFLTAVHQEMGRYILEVETLSEPPGANPLSGFSIRH